MRVTVESNKLENAVNDLRNKGYSNSDITQEINHKIGNSLYNGYSMPQESFEELQSITEVELSGEFHKLNNKIDRYDKSLGGVNKFPELEKSEELAEFIGYVLGDGHLEYSEKKTYSIEIVIHQDEVELRERIISLTKELFNYEARIREKNCKAVSINIYGKKAVEKLEDKGLQPGNKTENQVGVPKWIKNNKKFTKKCLKGLIDTDGCVYKNGDNYKKGSGWMIDFKNASRPLIRDYMTMMESIGYNTYKSGRNVSVSMSDTLDALNEIQPIKIKKLRK